MMMMMSPPLSLSIPRMPDEDALFDFGGGCPDGPALKEASLFCSTGVLFLMTNATYCTGQYGSEEP